MLPILFFVEDNYEELELHYPKIRLEEEGYDTFIAGPIAGKTYFGKHKYPVKAELSFADCQEKDFSALVIAGGFSPDRIRRDQHALELTQAFNKNSKPIAFICHGGWVPISAKILKGKKVTSTLAIKDDLENAGALFEDKAIVINDNLISSRTPKDLPFFVKGILKVLKSK
jgi:protease I